MILDGIKYIIICLSLFSGFKNRSHDSMELIPPQRSGNGDTVDEWRWTLHSIKGAIDVVADVSTTTLNIVRPKDDIVQSCDWRPGFSWLEMSRSWES